VRQFRPAVGELVFPHARRFSLPVNSLVSLAKIQALLRCFQMTENIRTILVELLLGGFFAVACIRASVPSAVNGKLRFTDFLRFPERLERLRRTRWQWFSTVAVLLAIRIQTGVSTILEVIVFLQFVIFFALPTRTGIAPGKVRSGYEPVVGSR
jgi:hypothetical protein